MTKLIGLTGKARCGKDTVAAMLAEYGYEGWAFADHLKSTLAHLMGEDVKLYHHDVHKEREVSWWPVSRRRAMQDFGNGLRKIFGESFWVDLLFSRWEDRSYPNLVVKDVRYDNEAQAVLDRLGVMVHVVRPGHEGLKGAAAQHVSEQGVSDDLVDYVIHNDGTLADLRCKVHDFVEWLKDFDELRAQAQAAGWEPEATKPHAGLYPSTPVVSSNRPTADELADAALTLAAPDPVAVFAEATFNMSPTAGVFSSCSEPLGAAADTLADAVGSCVDAVTASDSCCSGD